MESNQVDKDLLGRKLVKGDIVAYTRTTKDNGMKFAIFNGTIKNRFRLLTVSTYDNYDKNTNSFIPSVDSEFVKSTLLRNNILKIENFSNEDVLLCPFKTEQKIMLMLLKKSKELKNESIE